MTLLEGSSLWVLAWVAFVVILAGFAHGLVGFGFPIVATPLLAMVFDVKVAVLLTILPTLALSLLSTLIGGNFRGSVLRFWYMPFCLALGSYLGTRLLIVADPTPFTLVLAASIVIFLNLERLGKSEVATVRKHPVPWSLAFGMLAGLSESTVNIAAPALLIYFMLIRLNPASLVQTLNFCFVIGKGTQIITWTWAGGIGLDHWLSTLPLALAGLLFFFTGQAIRRRVSTVTYQAWLRGFLWIMAGLLVFQFAQLSWRAHV